MTLVKREKEAPLISEFIQINLLLKAEAILRVGCY